jgi:hypothetical protein
MTKTEHLQFLVLLIPTFLILIAVAVSMADLKLPAPEDTYSVAPAAATPSTDQVSDDRAAE